MSINESFFSEINKEYVFGQIKDIIMSNHSVNISLDNSYEDLFNKNMIKVFNYSDCDIVTLDQLNNDLKVSTVKLLQDKIIKLNNNKDIDNKDIKDAFERINSLRNNDDQLFIKEGNQSNKQISLLEGPIIGDNISNFDINNINNETEIPSLNNINNNENIIGSEKKSIDSVKNVDKGKRDKKTIKNIKTIKIMSYNRYDNEQASRFNYKYDLISNNIVFNNNKIEKIIIPIEDNYIFSSPIIFLKIQELKLYLSMKLEDTITNHHRKYGIYYPIENHNIKSTNIENITVNITDISETIHNNIDTLKIFQLEILNEYIILHNKYVISEYMVNDYIKLIEYEKNIIDMNSIINVPLKIEQIIDNKIFVKNINNINDLNVDINLRFVNLSNQNIIFIK